jgi:hypothetical protein
MKTMISNVLCFLFLYGSLFGQTKIDYTTEKYCGRYEYRSGCPNHKTLVEFDLYSNGHSIIYKDITYVNHNREMLEIEFETEEGYYNIKDSIISIFSKKDRLFFLLETIDSLNYKITYSDCSFLKVGDIIYRSAAYFNNDSWICSFLDYGICSRWLIQPNIIDSSSHKYECLYKTKQNGKTIEFYYDKKMILQDNIYIEQEDGYGSVP